VGKLNLNEFGDYPIRPEKIDKLKYKEEEKEEIGKMKDMKKISSRVSMDAPKDKMPALETFRTIRKDNIKQKTQKNKSNLEKINQQYSEKIRFLEK